MPVPGVPGVVKVTPAEPAGEIAVAGMAAVTWLPLTKVVALATPFQFTTAWLPKLVPLTVRVNAELPAVMLAGFSAAMVGTDPATGGGVLGVEPQARVRAARGTSSGAFTAFLCLCGVV